ncbi:MAG TPA: hypothetical protein VN700_11605 [Vicinamibacterales bacterium]|nr:hypothetical protein [Vicinamibacterales bacterium]
MPSPSRPVSGPAPSWVRWLWNTPWLWLALIVPLFCVPLFLGLGHTDLDNDEAIYSFAVETMLKDGDWLTPKYIPSETTAFLEKPPLKFWITYVPMRLGLWSPDEAGLRYMDAAMSAIALLYVFGIGRRLAGPVCGLVAVLLLFSQNALLFQHGLRSNNMESAMVLSYAAGVYHFLAWRSLNPDVKRHIFAMAFWFAVGFMCKFVAALFLPVILGLAALIKREDRGRLYRDWPSFALAALFAVALIAPWFMYQSVQRGPRLWDIMFGAHVMKRFTAYLDIQHLQPWHYYVTQFWAELEGEGTRLLVLIAAPLFLLQIWRRRWIEGAVLALWFVIPMAAISAGTSKLYHYAFPYLAPVALAGGWLVAVVASRLYAWTATPFAAIVRRRDAVLPGWLTSTRVQLMLTLAGAAGVIVALTTMAFDRLSVTIGGATIRNSSSARPAIFAAVAWIGAAPAEVLRAAVVAGLLAVALPLAAYKANVHETRIGARPVGLMRDCMAAISTQRKSAGDATGGTFTSVSTSLQSWLPFYYLHDLGDFNQGPPDSTPALLARLFHPRAPQMVLISPAHYDTFLRDLSADRAGVIEEAAGRTGLDTPALSGEIDQRAIGIVRIRGNILVLPAIFSRCGQEIFRLGTGG